MASLQMASITSLPCWLVTVVCVCVCVCVCVHVCVSVCNNVLMEFSLAHSQPCTKSLRELNISYNRCGDNGLYMLKLGLLANRSLEKLNLCQVKMTDEGVSVCVCQERERGREGERACASYCWA